MMAWKDNALVLSMSTVADGKSTVERLRKRPSETSSAAKTSRKPFGPNTRTTLPIPEYEDEYNHQIGAVDQGNQLKKPNTLEKLYRRGGHQSLVTWLLDTALTNAYKLSFHSDVPSEEKWSDQTKFRTEVLVICFAFAKENRRKRKSTQISTVEELEEASQEGEHTLQRFKNKRDCVVCLKEGVSRKVQRRVLEELSVNVPPNLKGSGCRKASIFGCKVCKVTLCKDSTCFARYHS
jgi:hypothetical protein